MDTALQNLEDAQAGPGVIREVRGAHAAETRLQRVRGKRKFEDEHPPMREASTRLSHDSSICAQCSNLDLLGALRKAIQIREHNAHLYEIDLHFRIHIADVGHRFRQLWSTECALCSILFNSRIAPDQSHKNSDDGDEIRLIGFLEWSGLFEFESPFREYDSAYLAVVPSPFGSGKIKKYKLLKDHVSDQGAAILLQDEGRPTMFAARKVPDGFDVGMVNTGMHYCKSNHSIPCGCSKVP